MIVLTLNNKGGVGKTTLAVELAAACEQLLGARVHGVDLDASALQVGPVSYETGGSFLDWYRGRATDSVLRLQVQRPAARHPLCAEELLRLGTQHEVLVLDGPIALSPPTLQALIAADLVLVPLRPAVFDIRATTNLFRPGRYADGTPAPSLLAHVTLERAKLGLPPPRVLVVLTFVSPDPRNREVRAARTEAALAGIEVLPAQLTQRLAYPRAQGIGESVLTVATRERDPIAAREVSLLARLAYQAFRGDGLADLEAFAAQSGAAALPPREEAIHVV